MGQPSHWDLMLERNGVLMTWRLPTLPAAWQDDQKQDAEVQLTAERIADHRLAYLDYEGPVSGNRGHVTRQDHGDYEVLEENAAVIRLRLSGQTIGGAVTLPLPRREELGEGLAPPPTSQR
jgi:hypothetical protein